MEDTSTLVWGILFGSIGLGYVMYGRKQRAGIALVAGVALMVFPYFVSEIYALIAVGIGLMALPYFIRI